MKINTPDFSLEVILDNSSSVPGFRQLSDALRRAIIDGIVPLSSDLPSVRDFCAQLDISRSTVMRSIQDLASQGYVVTAVGSGSKVASEMPGDFSQSTEFMGAAISPFDNRPLLSAYAERLLLLPEGMSSKTTTKWDLSGPPVELTPVKQWRAIYREHCRASDLLQFDYKPEPTGQLVLRQAYASYLTRARAVNCTPDQVVVFFARELRLDLPLKLLLRPGDYVAVENPCYANMRNRFLAHGAKVIPIPVDHQGMDVKYLMAQPHNFKFVYVAPSHNEPTGAVLSMARRRLLLDWAKLNGAFIIEDDYDSEYRYQSRPIPSLQGLDDGDCVLHLSCLWKILSPVVKLGFIVVPNRLKNLITDAKTIVERDLPLIDQLALTDFINQRHLDRLIRRNRKIYESRRKALVDALVQYFGAQVITSTESAGMDMLIRLESNLSDSEVEAVASEAGLRLASAASYYFGENKQGHFIIPFSLYEETSMREAVATFAGMLKG
jgi:GntR family transcriptional regulator/MocR family aminotransferase